MLRWISDTPYVEGRSVRGDLTFSTLFQSVMCWVTTRPTQDCKYILHIHKQKWSKYMNIHCMTIIVPSAMHILIRTCTIMGSDLNTQIYITWQFGIIYSTFSCAHPHKDMHKNVTIIEGNKILQIGHNYSRFGKHKLTYQFLLYQFLESNQVATSLLVNYW